MQLTGGIPAYWVQDRCVFKRANRLAGSWRGRPSGVYKQKMWSIFGLIVLLGISLSFSTANFALKEFSKVKLQIALIDRGKEKRFESLQKHHHNLILSCAVIRMSANLALILVITFITTGTGTLSMDKLIVSFLASILLLSVFSVAVPHAWSKYAAESFLASALPLLQAARKILRPLMALMHGIDVLVRRLAGVSIEPENSNGAEQEILEAVHEGEEEGLVNPQERKMIESVIELHAITIGQVMTPRTELIAVEANATIDQVKQIIYEHGHSRLPVFEDNFDNIVGMLYVKDLLQYLGQTPEHFSIREIMRPCYFVPETKSLRNLFSEFRGKQVHVAVVLDEYGGTLGLVTLEDLIEQIVGQIADEYEPSEPPMIKQIDSKTLEIDARTRTDQLNDEYNLHLPEDEDYETIAGFLFSSLGRIPVTGETFQCQNLLFTIIEATERKITTVRLEILPKEMTETQ